MSELEPISEPEELDTPPVPAFDPETGEILEHDGDLHEPEAAGAQPPAETPTPETGLSEQELGKRLDAVDRRGRTWVAFVDSVIAETEQPLVRCAVCLEQVPGYHFHPDVVPLSEIQLGACRVLAGMPIEPSFEQDPSARECETCKGWGRVKTGSKVPGQAVVGCTDCNGHGYKTSRGYDSPVPPVASTNGEPAAAILTEQEQAGEDAWGTPRNHPDWGKSPQYRSPTWQAELEAYKRGEPAPIA